MARRNEALDFVTAELSGRGIAYDIRTTGSSHIEIRWQVNKDKEVRSYFMPSTPSDHRNRLNCRADVRRLLKADGVTLDASTAVRKTLLAKALELPKHVETTPEQLRAIRSEISDLTELMLDISGAVGVLRDHILRGVRPAEPLGTASQEAPPARAPALKPSVRSIKAIDYLSHSWSSFEALARDMGLSYMQVYMKLHYLKKQGAAIEIDKKSARLKPGKPHLVAK